MLRGRSNHENQEDSGNLHWLENIRVDVVVGHMLASNMVTK